MKSIRAKLKLSNKPISSQSKLAALIKATYTSTSRLNGIAAQNKLHRRINVA